MRERSNDSASTMNLGLRHGGVPQGPAHGGFAEHAPCHSHSHSHSDGTEWFPFIFKSAIAETDDERAACFRTRYQVYCIDNRFEDANDNPGNLETDAYDPRAVHSLLTHRATGTAVGTVRLVLPRADGQRCSLPMQQLAGAAASDALAPFPIDRCAEISRFAILKSFHGYTPTDGPEAALSPQEWRRLLVHLPLGLVKCCIEMSVREGITHWAAVMEPSLLRLLRRFGIHMEPLGSMVEHHGRRQPCWTHVDSLLNRVRHERPDVWAFLTDEGRSWPSPPQVLP